VGECTGAIPHHDEEPTGGTARRTEERPGRPHEQQEQEEAMSQDQMTAEHLKQWEARPPARACRLLDFDKAEVRPGLVPRTFILIVSGTKPYANMSVELRPLTYVQQPEYWGIEVVGCLPGFGLPVVAPYTASLPLDGVTGRRGIEVLGATRREKLEVPPRGGPKPPVSPAA
jgi:hypothetical protein